MHDPDVGAVEAADRLSRRRRRGLWASAVLFVLWQGVFYTWGAPDRAPLRHVDELKVSAWVLWCLAIMLLLATGGGLLQRRHLGRLMNDEVSTTNRQAGQRFGFWAAMAAAVGVYVAEFLVRLSTHDAIHIIMTAGLGGALLRYALLERRSEREA